MVEAENLVVVVSKGLMFQQSHSGALSRGFLESCWISSYYISEAVCWCQQRMADNAPMSSTEWIHLLAIKLGKQETVILYRSSIFLLFQVLPSLGGYFHIVSLSQKSLHKSNQWHIFYVIPYQIKLIIVLVRVLLLWRDTIMQLL